MGFNQDNAAAFRQSGSSPRRPEGPKAENQAEESYFPEFMTRPDMAPQIVPSKFADCQNLSQVMEKIRGQGSLKNRGNQEGQLNGMKQ